MIITFIGYRGTGKSRIAPLLAERLGWPWADADVELERNSGRSIREIFATDGEPAFRAMERMQLVELLQSPKLVLAAGGGAILNADTRADFRAAGPVIWLQADESTIADRILDRPGSAHRPNLTPQGGRDEIRAMLALRTPLYAETASITVRTDGRHPQSVANEIMAALPEPLRIPAGGRP
ncbi:MAG: shikimate kinase [Planctomycetaceae bacterium]|nr:shikimate kinase [Planctomycetaceae bacterium]